MFNGAHASAIVVDDHSPFQSTNAIALLVHRHAKLDFADNAIVVLVLGRANGTHALAVSVSHLTLLDGAEIRVATYHRVSTITRQALAHHCPQWLGIEHLALGINSAR